MAKSRRSCSKIHTICNAPNLSNITLILWEVESGNNVLVTNILGIELFSAVGMNRNLCAGKEQKGKQHKRWNNPFNFFWLS